MAGAESGMSGAGIPLQPQPQAPAAAAGPADESSDSEGEHEGPQKLIRKVSTSGQIRSKVRGAGAGQPRRLHGRFLYPHPQAGLTRSWGRPLHPARIPGSGGGELGGGRFVRQPCLFLPFLSPPPRPAVASTSVPGWQEEPPGAAALRLAGGEAACPGGRPALPGVLGVGEAAGCLPPSLSPSLRLLFLGGGHRCRGDPALPPCGAGGLAQRALPRHFPYPPPTLFSSPPVPGTAAVRPARAAGTEPAVARRAPLRECRQGGKGGFHFERHLAEREVNFYTSSLLALDP